MRHIGKETFQFIAFSQKIKMENLTFRKNKKPGVDVNSSLKGFKYQGICRLSEQFEYYVSYNILLLIYYQVVTMNKVE